MWRIVFQYYRYVCIGTTSPVGKLHINATSGQIVLEDTDEGDALRIERDGSGLNVDLVSSNLNLFRVNDNGNVGIGITNPSTPLYVKNNTASTGVISAQGSAATSASEQYIFLYNDDLSQNIYLEVNGSTNPSVAGTRTYAPRLESNGARGLGISAYTGPLNFWTGLNVNAMSINTSGNVGIGTESSNLRIIGRFYSITKKREISRLQIETKNGII